MFYLDLYKPCLHFHHSSLLHSFLLLFLPNQRRTRPEAYLLSLHDFPNVTLAFTCCHVTPRPTSHLQLSPDRLRCRRRSIDHRLLDHLTRLAADLAAASATILILINSPSSGFEKSPFHMREKAMSKRAPIIHATTSCAAVSARCSRWSGVQGRKYTP